jgi:hypothetical protein
MKKYLLMLSLIAGGASHVFGQYVVSGQIKDDITKEELLGAVVVYGPGQGVVADFNGYYELNLPVGNYTLEYSYVGYEKKQVLVNVTGPGQQRIDVSLSSITLQEVRIIADMARTRETPVAFSTISPKQIQEELASQDIPMILNTTPGVYATQTGGGDGDARINIRGFNQQNIAVMIDGIPVNDMLNRQVYWSNWFGLDNTTASIQVQRGLGASKLALPAIGGTINIITTPIDTKPSAQVKQEFGSGNLTRTSFMLNTGKTENGWGLTLAGSYKKGDGLVDGTFTEGYYYYMKVGKIWDKHRLSFTGFGAPQIHGQRSFKSELAEHDKDFARKHGVADSIIDNIPEYGRYYNQHWGVYEDYDMIGVSDNPPPPPFPPSADRFIITRRGGLNEVVERVNFYHKPQFNLRHVWQLRDDMNLTTSAYMSIGRGGGVQLDNLSGVTNNTVDGRIDFQEIYDRNIQAPDNPDFDFINIDTTYSDTEIKADNFLRVNRNDHFWTGVLSQYDWTVNDYVNFTAGIDLRHYVGGRYSEVYEMIGGDYVLDSSDRNKAPNQVKRVGDRFNQDRDATVNWGGTFVQAEYKSGNLTAVVNATVSTTSMWVEDRFRAKVIEVDGEQIEIGYNTSDTINDVVYDRNTPGLQYYQTEKVNIPGYNVKLGANYNLTESMNIFANIGRMSIAPVFDNVINRSSVVFEDFFNEDIWAMELGYQFGSPKFSGNVNGYYTIWGNRPVSRSIQVPYPADGVNGEPAEITSVFIRSVDALHRGIEFDGAYVISPKFKIQGLFSVGLWEWQNSASAIYTQQNTVIVDANGDPLEFELNLDGIRVGDAAQFQLGGAFEYMPTRNSYVRLRFFHFGQHYANFAVQEVSTSGPPEQSWKIPDYQLFDLHAGHTFRFDKQTLRFGLSVFNLFDAFYISDAQNNDTFTRFTNTQRNDAASAGVFPGLGRRFNLFVAVEF